MTSLLRSRDDPASKQVVLYFDSGAAVVTGRLCYPRVSGKSITVHEAKGLSWVASRPGTGAGSELIKKIEKVLQVLAMHGNAPVTFRVSAALPTEFDPRVHDWRKSEFGGRTSATGLSRLGFAPVGAPLERLILSALFA